MSLGLLDQPQTQPNSGHNVWLMCVYHAVVDGAWAFAGYYGSTTKATDTARGILLRTLRIPNSYYKIDIVL